MYFLFVFIILNLHCGVYGEDRVCVPRHYGHSSIVCVCNSTYCDDISSVGTQAMGTFVYYTSTQHGKRFQKTSGVMKNYNDTHSKNTWFSQSVNPFLNFQVTLDIRRSFTYQSINGFGGAVTDATGINIMKLSPSTRDNLINSYFSPLGLEYNMIRIPIGGSDFSTHPYAYNMYPPGDKNLSNFSLSMEDFNYKIPVIKQANAVAPEKVLLSAATWSPPLWMKTSNVWGGVSSLKLEYYQTYADYHYKFIDEYKKAGLDMWSISTGNEPTLGVLPIIPISAVGWLPVEQAKWIAENLGPTLKKSQYSDTNILAVDELRFTLPLWLDMMSNVNDALKYIDGIAVHWYFNAVIPPSVLEATHARYPNKFLISTEGSAGVIPITAGVSLGAWERGENYIRYIIEDLNHWITGWIDWNMVLDRKGGPNWMDHHVDSPVIALPESDEFVKQPTFYAMGHFSKFIPRDSKRVHVNALKGSVDNVAFLRPDGGVAVVMFNANTYNKTVLIKDRERGSFKVLMPPKSFQTVVYW